MDLEKPKKQPNLNVYYGKGYYSVTINPDDKHQYLAHSDRLQKFRNYANELLLPLAPLGIEYKFNIELSEPRDCQCTSIGPRLHLHGVLHFCSKKSVRQFLLNEFYRITRSSYMELDTIDDPGIWIKYCEKQQLIMDTPSICSNNDLFMTIKPTPKGTSFHDSPGDSSESLGEALVLPHKDIVVNLQDCPAEGDTTDHFSHAPKELFGTKTDDPIERNDMLEVLEEVKENIKQTRKKRMPKLSTI